MRTPRENQMRFIDLFCGVGGFRQALESLGHRCVFSSDIDKDACESYELNYEERPHGDIAEIPASDLPKHDVLCAGFPCQPFSISGNQNGFEDARGTLLYEILRIAGFHQPAVLFLENVKNYRSHAGGKTLEKTLRLLTEANYHVHYKILNASDFGVPQKRERIYFICFRTDLGVQEFSFPSSMGKEISLEKILLREDDPRLRDLWVERSDLTLKSKLPKEGGNRPLRIGTVGKGGQGERVYSVKGHAITLSAFGGGIGAKTGMYLINDKIRRLHPIECRRLMGFPESFQLHPRPNVCYKQFGNSVVVPVVSHIFKAVQAHLVCTKQGSLIPHSTSPA